MSDPVVVENAMDPDPADVAHGTVREYRGVFDRNVALIIETIRYPASQRFWRKLAFIHHHVERMFVVVGSHSNRSQFFGECFAVPKAGSHNTISSPSRAISIPACSSCARSRLPGIRIGFVLFMCV